MKLGLKDINLVLQQATFANQPMPLASLLQKNMQQMIIDDKENIDWSAVSLGALN
jgi:3-hydroxyisobutyrate dehydrogenase-like beta-hydroxyacid dehydrogenase